MKNNAPSNNSMDVRAKQKLCLNVARQTQTCVAAVSPHVISSVGRFIVEVQDNLNTHNASAFYENLPARAARALTKRFEFHFTPKKGSWLNMAEMELSALARQCLSRRIADIETLSSELESIVKERNKLAVKFKWQFTVENAREKLNRHYENVILKTNVT